MGYRSNVTIVFYTRQRDKSRAAFIKAWLSERGILDIADEDGWGQVQFDENRGVQLTFTDTKWYESYDGVKKINNAFHQFMTEVCDSENPDDKPSDSEYACEFMRIGEEDDDIESMSSDYNECMLRLQREIWSDF